MLSAFGVRFLSPKLRKNKEYEPLLNSHKESILEWQEFLIQFIIQFRANCTSNGFNFTKQA